MLEEWFFVRLKNHNLPHSSFKSNHWYILGLPLIEVLEPLFSFLLQGARCWFCPPSVNNCARSLAYTLHISLSITKTSFFFMSWCKKSTWKSTFFSLSFFSKFISITRKLLFFLCFSIHNNSKLKAVKHRFYLSKYSRWVIMLRFKILGSTCKRWFGLVTFLKIIIYCRIKTLVKRHFLRSHHNPHAG